MSRPTRRHFIATGSAAFASIAVIRTPARAAQFTYKLGHDQPASHPIGVGANEVAEAVRRESNGRLDIKVFPDSILGGDPAMVAQVRSGALEMNLQAGGVLSAVVPVAGIERLGFAFSKRSQALAAMDGALGAYIRKELEAKGIYTFEKIWEAGFRQITTSTKSIRNVDDIAGLKIRTPPGIISTDLFKTLGAAPTSISSNELYTALQTHVVDAEESPFINIIASKMFEVQKYLSLTNHQWTGYWFTMNPEAYKALPPDLQGVLRRVANRVGAAESRSADLLNSSSAEKLKRLGMILNVADTATFRAKLGSYYTRWKTEFGAGPFGLLEQYTGKLG